MDKPYVTVDPNEFAQHDHDLSPILIEDVPDGLGVGDEVFAAQPDHDYGPTWIADAVIEEVDTEKRLAYLRVNWGSFRSEVDDPS